MLKFTVVLNGFTCFLQEAEDGMGAMYLVATRLFGDEILGKCQEFYYQKYCSLVTGAGDTFVCLYRPTLR